MATYEIMFNPYDDDLSVGDDVAPWYICNVPHGITLLSTALAIKSPGQGASIIIDIEWSHDAVTWNSIFGAPFIYGAHDGLESSGSLIDSGANFTQDLAGLIIQNGSDGSSGIISAVNSPTNLSVTLGGGTDNDWDIDDGYIIAVAGAIQPGEYIGVGGTPTVTELKQGELLRLDTEQCGVSPNPGSKLSVVLGVRH